MNIYLDIETISVPEKMEGNLLMQLAYIVEKEAGLYDLCSCYFLPERYKEMSVESMMKTRITPEKLEVLAKRDEQSSEIVLNRLQKFLSNPDTVLWIHNAEFDLEILKRAGIEVKCKVICTMRLMKFINDATDLPFNSISLDYLFYDLKRYQLLEELAWRMKIPMEDLPHSHEALFDCLSLYLLVEWLKKNYNLKEEICLNITNNPIKLNYCSFGKNRGMKWSEMTQGQLRYFYDLDDKDIKYTIDLMR